jgi:hypothetical protein
MIFLEVTQSYLIASHDRRSSSYTSCVMLCWSNRSTIVVRAFVAIFCAASLSRYTCTRHTVTIPDHIGVSQYEDAVEQATAIWRI